MQKEEQEALARSLQVNLIQQHSKYLGINFKSRGNRIANFHFPIDKLKSKLQVGKLKFYPKLVGQL